MDMRVIIGVVVRVVLNVVERVVFRVVVRPNLIYAEGFFKIFKPFLTENEKKMPHLTKYRQESTFSFIHSFQLSKKVFQNV